MDLLIATANPGKVKEFREMLGSDRFTWHDLTHVPNFVQVPETGETFLDNASLKAAGYAHQSNMWALADDSGLEVDALHNKPGVHSARWAQINDAGSGDRDNNLLLLRQLENVPDAQRTVRFVCVLALADPRGRIVLTARDQIEGRILHEPRGDNGFGYDPLFFVDAVACTTAELTPARKHEISHRGKALMRLRDMMNQLGPLDPP